MRTIRLWQLCVCLIAIRCQHWGWGVVLYSKVLCLEATGALEEVLCCEVQCIIGSPFCEQKDRQTDRTEKITLSQHRCREVMTPQQFYIKPRDFRVNFYRLQQ